MRLAIVLFAVGLASCQSQHVQFPAVAPPPIELEGVRVTKIVIDVDVDGGAMLCVKVTPEMRMERILGAELCGYTIGELRSQYSHLSNAN